MRRGVWVSVSGGVGVSGIGVSGIGVSGIGMSGMAVTFQNNSLSGLPLMDDSAKTTVDSRIRPSQR